MRDTTLFAVLRMPPEMWRNGEMDVAQRYARYKEAADLILKLRRENIILKKKLKKKN